ncbi:hypothetical protein L798_14541 [Zootermopsis nevadensis]|uniref:Uncharacterized protein n=1 Tax=Zootermopsis nevadensis TaxID=136037 RepID=A0A067QPC4_ZOONE|nr:hypothetical protein L798_14541 [Zootermopsis nevadensis]
MARLTEEMVIARTRASDLSNIRKLNCWGSELSDVSLLRRMQNVEVLSLSHLLTTNSDGERVFGSGIESLRDVVCAG